MLRVFKRATKRKVFGIGRNKTGTTSLREALREMGMRVAPQAPAEKLVGDWAKRDFRKLIQLCHSYDVFQDVPFSLPYTFEILDHEFPNSKFILTVRESADVWFDSLVRFHSKLFGDGNLPTWKDLERATYLYRGFMAEAHRQIYAADQFGLYNRERYIEHYESHNATVRDYFRYRPNDLLILNVSDPDSMARLCSFLDVPFTNQSFPWVNKT